MRPGWISAWWDAFGAGGLELLAARRDHRLVGVLPLVHRHDKIVSPTNWHTPEFGAVAVDEAGRRALYEAAFAEHPRRLDASFLAIEGPDAEWMRRLADGYRVVSRVVMSSPYVPVAGDWSSYWSSLSKNLRATVRRCRNRLSDLGEVTVEVSDGRDGLAELLEEGFRLEASGWKGEKGTAIISQPETRSFYEAVSRWAAEQGTLQLAFLKVDGVSVAFNLNLEANGHCYLLKPGHDAALDSFGPGTVLTAEMVERTFSSGLSSYEFLGGADAYKLRWGGSCHDRLRVQAFASGPVGALDRLVQTRGRRTAKTLLRR